MRLEGKVAVVTGGAQGIGRAIALGLGREGAKIVVADLQADKARNVADELHALGTEGYPAEVNVANESSVKRLASATFDRFGRVDILVNDGLTSIWSSPACRISASETPNSLTRCCMRSIDRCMAAASTVGCCWVGSAW